jgi:hypothetical protein
MTSSQTWDGKIILSVVFVLCTAGSMTVHIGPCRWTSTRDMDPLLACIIQWERSGPCECHVLSCLLLYCRSPRPHPTCFKTRADRQRIYTRRSLESFLFPFSFAEDILPSSLYFCTYIHHSDQSVKMGADDEASMSIMSTGLR